MPGKYPLRLDGALIPDRLFDATFAPVIHRPQPIVKIEVPPLNEVRPDPDDTGLEIAFSISGDSGVANFLNPAWVALSKKLTYWVGREQSLQRPEYFMRHTFDGATCFHGAKGADQRFSRWRLAFHESTRIAGLMGEMRVFRDGLFEKVPDR